MEPNNKTRNSSQRDAQTFEQLQSIFTLINQNTYSSRKESFKLLLEVDITVLSVRSLTYYHFIFGRYYLNQYKASKNISDLENANRCFDDSAFTEVLNGRKTTNQDYLYARAKTKYLLSKVSKQAKKEEFYCYSLHLTLAALKLNPNNPSFKSLLNHLENMTF